MGTLKEKAQSILTEKTNKIKPGNIKKNVQIFDVTGTYSADTVWNIDYYLQHLLIDCDVIANTLSDYIQTQGASFGNNEVSISAGGVYTPIMKIADLASQNVIWNGDWNSPFLGISIDASAQRTLLVIGQYLNNVLQVSVVGYIDYQPSTTTLYKTTMTLNDVVTLFDFLGTKDVELFSSVSIYNSFNKIDLQSIDSSTHIYNNSRLFPTGTYISLIDV